MVWSTRVIALVAALGACAVGACGAASGAGARTTSAPAGPTLILGGVARPLPVRRDRLLVLPQLSASAGTVEEVVAALAPLLRRHGLVVAPLATTGVVSRNPHTWCNWGPQLVLARADGRDLPDRHSAALAALRAHPNVRAAGPLLRGADPRGGHMLIGRVIHITVPASLPATLELEVARSGLTFGPTQRTIELPTSMGLDAVDVANRLAAMAPEAGLVLDFAPAVVCTESDARPARRQCTSLGGQDRDNGVRTRRGGCAHAAGRPAYLRPVAARHAPCSSAAHAPTLLAAPRRRRCL